MATAVELTNPPHPARDHCLAPSRTANALTGGHRYTRMFPDLPHLEIDMSVLHAIGLACDATGARRQESRTVAAGWPVCEDGERLGAVGSLIVAEVLLGIVDGDPESFRSVDPSWQPTLPSRDPSRFTIADLLAPA